ncbi:MAG TPA: O-succinylhomoserine sulfhydrylase, partial [Gammaproteobacteria bacterium]|nr:O-succinylhomoserine sulfhydrylase [Gammaproteobacteria bacterium]
SAADAAEKFSGNASGNVYSRFSNPTVRAFETRLAQLENATYCLATASGMSAILLLALALLKSGDHVVVAKSVFGSTVTLFSNVLSRFGITMDFVDITDLDQWAEVLTHQTRLLFIETPSNPLMEIGDIAALAELAHQNGSILVVDNAYCTPALQCPILLGADVVVHSATKYLDGQGRCIGGALVTANKKLQESFFSALRSAGPAMSPFNAWVFHKGLETLQLRMKAHSENAMKVAQWLTQHPAVDRVYYPGLKVHPGHHLAKKQQSAFGGVLSFEVRGTRDHAWRVIDSTKWLSITANLGDVKTTITHPATTTHARITDAQRAAAGIHDNLLRISVGLENPTDIIDDLSLGLSDH